MDTYNTANIRVNGPSPLCFSHIRKTLRVERYSSVKTVLGAARHLFCNSSEIEQEYFCWENGRQRSVSWVSVTNFTDLSWKKGRIRALLLPINAYIIPRDWELNLTVLAMCPR